MSSLFFWIIILSFVVPMAMRAYRRSIARRDRNQGLPGGYPEQFPGQFGPGGYPGPGQYPAPGQYPGSAGPQSNQPRDGYTQQDYFSGGFGQPGRQVPPPQPIGDPQPLPYQYGQPSFQQAPAQSSGPATPPPPAAPQGFRARKLAELDQQYSNGELSMEEYMKRRGDIMNG
ncbi:MAG TPA: hypothetical protein VLJ40_07225 [Arthrobacter sp.]|nr:hypothetical protein [Arthrobacter sp.]